MSLVEQEPVTPPTRRGRPVFPPAPAIPTFYIKNGLESVSLKPQAQSSNSQIPEPAVWGNPERGVNAESLGSHHPADDIFFT